MIPECLHAPLGVVATQEKVKDVHEMVLYNGAMPV